MATTIEILNSIKTQLAKKLPKVKVDIFPQDPKQWRFQNAGANILIGYNSSSFANQEATDVVLQERTLNIDLIVIAKGLHNDFGALEILDKTRMAIVGFKPKDSSQIYLINEEFLSEEQGAWFYRLVIETKTQQVQAQINMDI